MMPMTPPSDPAEFAAARYRETAASMLWLANLRPLDAASVQLAIEAAFQLRAAQEMHPTGKPS